MTLDVLQDRIGYRFKDESLLVLAVTHSSWANEHAAGNAHNERLEFLGDAVLEIAVSAQLFARFPDAREGELTRLRSSLVNEATLAAVARKLHLDGCLRLARGEENQGGRQRDSLLSDAMEAVFGGVFVDGGIEEARAVKLVKNDVNRRVNAELANQTRSAGAAQHQLALIDELEQRGLRDALPDALAVFCDLRERYPDLSLRDLGEMADPPLSKSALYHRVLRLEKLIEANR